MATLHANHREITTPFGLIGSNENALSFALGYTFQQGPRLLQWFLAEIGLPGIRLSSLAKARIILQRHRSEIAGQGITDLEIHLPGSFHVVIEAKIGMSVPTLDQCRKYVPRLASSDEPKQRLVALVQSADVGFEARYGAIDAELRGRLRCFHWAKFIAKCIRVITNGQESAGALQAVRWFYHFLDQEFHMKTFTTEVWIVPIGTKPLWQDGMSFLEIHEKHRIYFDDRMHSVRPLYIGFRAAGMLKSLYRVTKIEHEMPVSKHAAGLKTEWKDTPQTIWHLDEPFALPSPIPTGNGMFRRRTLCDFDLLLSCKSVLEIETAMRKRRSGEQKATNP
jgi:hypothetical protein